MRLLPARRVWALACAAGLAGALLSGCTHDDDSPEATTPTTTGPEVTLTRDSAPLDVSIAQLSGSVPKGKRAAITTAISKPIGAWIDGAFLDGPYPTADFSDGFSSWTAGAATLAAKDKDTTTNAALGSSTIAVVADQRIARLFVFGANGRPGGATASVRLRLTEQQADSSLTHVLVTGRVYLTPGSGGWKIFGYDLSRTEGKA